MADAGLNDVVVGAVSQVIADEVHVLFGMVWQPIVSLAAPVSVSAVTR
jgi:hypothetical protein